MFTKLTISILALLLAAPVAMAQDNDMAEDEGLYELLTEYEVGECPRFILNAEFLIARYNDEGKFDSVYMVLDYVEQRCGREHFFDYEILHQIELGEFPADYCEELLIEKMLDESGEPIPYWSSGMDDIDTDQMEFSPYHTFMKNLAESLAARTDTNSIAHLVCRHYTGDRAYVMGRLRRNEFKGTCLQDEYNARVSRIEDDVRKLRGHLSGGLGVWIPGGNTDLLGVKPEIVVNVGTRSRWFGVDLGGAVRFLESSEFYELYYNERLVPSDDFIGGYVGLSLTAQLFSLGRNSVHLNSGGRYTGELFAGGGYDGFAATIDEESVGVDSYNLHFGLRLRYFYNKERTMFGGLQFKYSFVDYDTGGGTDLSGHTISVSVLYGFLGNIKAVREARRLHYYD